jgi:hypothetical protein
MKIGNLELKGTPLFFSAHGRRNLQVVSVDV